MKAHREQSGTKDRYSNALPAGTYTIMVRLADGTPLPSMTLNSVTIPAGPGCVHPSPARRLQNPHPERLCKVIHREIFCLSRIIDTLQEPPPYREPPLRWAFLQGKSRTE
jgi:hypothetical protein